MNIEFFKTHLPHVEVEWFEDGIHGLELQKTEAMANLIIKFLHNNRTKDPSD